MKKQLIALTLSTLTFSSFNAVAEQDPRVQKEIDSYQGHFKAAYPALSTDLNLFANGNRVFNKDKQFQYEAQMIDNFEPPFTQKLAEGEKLWGTPFKNGKTFSSCYTMKEEDIKPSFPRWNNTTKQVDTLEATLNECRAANGEKPWKYGKGKIAYVSAYLGTLSEGKITNVVVPKGNEDAYKAWENGRENYFAKRGQLGLACADCHVHSAGKFIRGDVLSSGLSTRHFPVWRGKWAKNNDGYGTLQRRFAGCYKQVRAKPQKLQSEDYRNLEYFLASMGNGLEHRSTEYRQ